MFLLHLLHMSHSFHVPSIIGLWMSCSPLWSQASFTFSQHLTVYQRLCSLYASSEHFPQLGILQWASQFDQFPLYSVRLSMFSLLHHLLPLSLHLHSSLNLPLPPPAPHQSLFCSTISKSATVLPRSSSGLSPHSHLSFLVFPWGNHLK